MCLSEGAGVHLFSTSTSKLLVHAASSIYSLNESEEPHNEISQLLHLRHSFVCMHIKILQRLIYIYSTLVLTERMCFASAVIDTNMVLIGVLRVF